MQVSIRAMFEQLAAHGTAPREGCTIFGVGYEDVFERLKKTYLTRRFGAGLSAEKFVIGPFGSGKTHFLRQLMEMARAEGCVTSEVQLNKQVDFTKSLVVFKEACKGLQTPDGTRRGINNFITDAVARLESKAADASDAEGLVRGWVTELDEADFESPAFVRMARRAFEAYLAKDDVTFQAACRWLSGDVADRPLAKELGVSPIPAAEHALYGRRALLSLFQLVRRAGFPGTVLALDEAEQGLSVDKKKTEKILSMLQSELNAINDLQGGSALVLFAFTPDLVEKFDQFAALQARVADPGPGMGFFDGSGNNYAPKIDLTQRNSLTELKHMGERLIVVFYDALGSEIATPQNEAHDRVVQLAEEVWLQDASSSSRRTMVKQTSAMLLHVLDHGAIPAGAIDEPVVFEDEV